MPTSANGWQAHPDWSPDGQRIAFAADDARQTGESVVTRDLWVSDANGHNAERVLDCELPCVVADYPAWSPDGQSLALDMVDIRDNIEMTSPSNGGASLSIPSLHARTVGV